jgi:hypothetical protein
LHNLVRFVPQSPASSKKRGRKKEKKKKPKRQKQWAAFPGADLAAVLSWPMQGFPGHYVQLKAVLRARS